MKKIRKFKFHRDSDEDRISQDEKRERKRRKDRRRAKEGGVG